MVFKLESYYIGGHCYFSIIFWKAPFRGMLRVGLHAIRAVAVFNELRKKRLLFIKQLHFSLLFANRPTLSLKLRHSDVIVWSSWYYYRQDAAKRQTAGIVFTHRPKIRFFAPQGRLVAPIQAKLCSTDGHLGPLGCAKFHVNRCRRVGMRPQNIKNFHFLVNSRPVGATPLTDFQKF